MRKIAAGRITPEQSQTTRKPRQKRSQLRFELVLDAAERLLADHKPEDISIYTVAEATGMSPPSIYHLFPDVSQLFVALSERIHQEIMAVSDAPTSEPFTTWQELMTARFRNGRDYYNAHPAARRLLLGSGLSAAIRARDLDIDRELAVRSIEELRHYFEFADTADMVERFTELLVINDALWALSVHRHDIITDAYEEQARRAREAYCRTFLPEYLQLRAPVTTTAEPIDELEEGTTL